VEALVRQAIERGATCLTGGERLDGPGWFYRPTVLADVPDDADLLREEIFGPVAPIRTFATEAEAIAEANATEYGLVAYAFTRDADRILRLIDALDTGMIGVNRGLVSTPAAPFGGVKASGFGREGGPEGMEDYLETRYVAINAMGRP
jgi:succinate-semialdehyde dehydrogenase/glutarate-semialdehyde dehydrogenase